MRAAVCMLVRTDYEKRTRYKGERTSCVFPPRDVDELLDVADLLRLYKTCYERLETRRMPGRHLPWRGASFEGNIIPMSTTSTVLWLIELYSRTRKVPYLSHDGSAGLSPLNPGIWPIHLYLLPCGDASYFYYNGQNTPL